MEKGAITEYIDVAQIAIWTFWVFFVGLVIWLRREDKREGYPCASDRTDGRVSVIGWPNPPEPKTFILPHGRGTAQAPSERVEPAIKAVPSRPWPGAPLDPTGNPMVDGVGPAAYAQRADVPDLTVEGTPRIVPMRVAKEFEIESRDPDPRGMPVLGCDREVAGKVVDVWVDRSEVLIRYFEVELSGGKRVLLPWTFSIVDTRQKVVNVQAILASQFAQVPTTKAADKVTRLEEDKICAYYGGGKLYAVPSRAYAI